MGQAKQRGTFEDRKRLAIAEQERGRAEVLPPAIPVPIGQQSTMMLSLALASMLSRPMPRRSQPTGVRRP